MRRGRRHTVGVAATLGRRAVLLGLPLALLAGSAQAQPAGSRVVFDGTFGNPGAADTIDLGGGNFDHRIDYCAASCGAELPGGSHGQLVGTGLFQSLQYLDLVSGDEATFAASSGDLVTNVFARVTGGEPSQIWGILNSEIPGAGVWLMNSDGFVFGPTSGVNVDSSFAVTSADELAFAGGQVFEAAAGGAVPTLAVAAPVSFGFWVDTEAPGTVRVEGSTGLAAGDGATLSLVGGRVEVTGGDAGQSPRIVQSQGGRIQLAAAPAGAGGETLQIPVDLTDPGLDVADLGTDAAVVLDSEAWVEVDRGDASAPSGIVIRAGRFAVDFVSGDSLGGTLRASRTGDAAVPAIDVEVAGDLELDIAVVESRTLRDGPSGDIRLVGGDVFLSGGTQVNGEIRPPTHADPGPDIHVEATAPDGVVSVTGGSRIQTFDELAGRNTGKLGDITIVGDDVAVSGATTAVQTQVRGAGDAGTIHIDAADAVTVENGARVFANRAPGRPGLTPTDFGSIRVDAAELVVREGGVIQSETANEFQGAAVEIGYAAPIERVEVTGGAIGSVATGTGRGGDVSVDAGDLIVQASATMPELNPQISTLTTRVVDDSGTEPVVVGGQGDGGDLSVAARTLTLEGGGQLRAVTQGDGAAGDMTVDVEETLLARGRFTFPDPDPTDNVDPESRPSGIFGRSSPFEADTTPPPGPTTGPGGNVVITAAAVVLSDGAEFSTSAESAGPAGDLSVTADTILVEGPATSTIASKGSVGDGGDLTLRAAESLVLRDGGEATVSSRGTGQAGNLVVVSPLVEITGGTSGLFAQSLVEPPNPAGRAGSISLSPPEGQRLVLRVADGGNVSVESSQSAAGTIAIDSADLVEVVDGGEISATVASVPTADAGLASDITIQGAGAVVVRNGTITAETLQNGRGGSIVIDAVTVDFSEGARITAESRSGSATAGDAGSISIAAAKSFDVTDTTLTTQSDGGAGGDITIHDTDKLTLGAGTRMTAETTGAGPGGQITIRDVRSVLIRDGAALTTRSTAADGGNAGNIVIAASERFEAQNSSITTTAADAGGGRISIQAGKLVYLLDAEVITTVNTDDPDQGGQEDAGDIDIPLRGDEVRGLETVEPQFVVINRSTIEANANATNAGNINIAGADVLISRESVIEATSERGLSGVIQITSPDAEIVSQVTALPSDFVDPSDRLLPACVARTQRTGSFTVESRPAPPPSPDAPLAPPAAPDAAASDTLPRCTAPLESL